MLAMVARRRCGASVLGVRTCSTNRVRCLHVRGSADTTSASETMGHSASMGGTHYAYWGWRALDFIIYSHASFTALAETCRY